MITELLPVGSVVLLKNAIKKLVIIGIKPTAIESEPVEYDYVGVLYPEGFLGADSNFLFNHEDINDVIFVGYNNPERESFLQLLETAFEQSTKAPKEEMSDS